MDSFRCRNVNDGFPVGLLFLRERGVPLPSRNGPVLEYPGPVSVRYDAPCERVLFNRKRAINPFLHFFEPLWILAGQEDVAFLSNIVARFTDYSDDGNLFFGAYGKRLREPVDQIELAIKMFKENPDDRRVVMQIRRPDDMGVDSKDVPCNISIAFKIRNGKLNMHVFNRSNDYIWGMFGANVVQFSTLQEYVAHRVGVPVGIYHQTTDSLHVYTENPQWEKLKNTDVYVADPYKQRQVAPFPLIAGELDADAFDYDLDSFFDSGERELFHSSYFTSVVRPMWRTFVAHKNGRNGLDFVDQIGASDWRAVTKQWLSGKEK